MKTKEKEQQGKGTADHLMPLGYLFQIVFIQIDMERLAGGSGFTPIEGARVLYLWGGPGFSLQAPVCMQKFLSISFAKSCYSVRKIEITLGIFRLWMMEHVTFLLLVTLTLTLSQT